MVTAAELGSWGATSFLLGSSSSSSSSRADPVLSQSGVAWGLCVSLQGLRELTASPDVGDLLLPLLHTKDWDSVKKRGVSLPWAALWMQQDVH